MTTALFVSNASPLIALVQIHRLDLLRQLFAEILAPSAVASEVAPTLPVLPPWILERPILEPIPPEVVRARLDPGETEAIALAIERTAVGIVLDDRRGRRLARTLAVHVVGTLGVLALAKRRGLIPAVGPELEALVAVRFHVRPDIARSVREEAGEATDRVPPAS